MRYYSDLTNKIYETENALVEAEEAHNAKLEEKKQLEERRKADYEKVKEAYKAAEAQKKAADELLQEFLKKYKGVHETTDKTKFLSTRQYLEDQKDLINAIFSSFPFFF